MFEVNLSSYRYWANKTSEPSSLHVLLCAEVCRAYRLSNGSAGARIIAEVVSQMGILLSRYRAGKLMKVLHLLSSQRPKHTYKKARKEHIYAPNRLKRKFTTRRLSTIWCGDVTYLWNGRRWAYLAVVKDLFARKIVGWAMSYSLDTALTNKALTMADESRGKPDRAVFHSAIPIANFSGDIG